LYKWAKLVYGIGGQFDFLLLGQFENGLDAKAAVQMDMQIRFRKPLDVLECEFWHNLGYQHFSGVQLGDPVSDRTFICFVFAGGAEPENLQAVVDEFVAKAGADPLLKLFEIRLEKLEHGVAFQADQVVVVFISPGRFIVGVAGAQAVLADEPGLHQQIQGSVDGGSADISALVAQFRMQGFRVEMAVALEDGGQDGQSFAREFQLFAPKESFEANFLRGANLVSFGEWAHEFSKSGTFRSKNDFASPGIAHKFNDIQMNEEPICL